MKTVQEITGNDLRIMKFKQLQKKSFIVETICITVSLPAISTNIRKK